MTQANTSLQKASSSSLLTPQPEEVEKSNLSARLWLFICPFASSMPLHFCLKTMILLVPPFLSMCLTFELTILTICRVLLHFCFFSFLTDGSCMWNLFSPLLDFPFLCFLLTQCTQSTKDVLERAIHSFDLHELCPPGTPKTTPLGMEAPSSEASASAGCSHQDSPQPVAGPCPPFSRRNKRDSLHSINPAFRLASPSPSLSRATLVLGDAPEVGFIPLSWVYQRTKAVRVLFVPATVNTPSSLLECSWLHRHLFMVVSPAVCFCFVFLPIWFYKMLSWWVDQTLPESLMSSQFIFLYVRVKANLSNTWKHNIEIFF